MSLVEVALALVLAAIGVSAVTRAGNAALRVAGRARTIAAETTLAGIVADSLSALPTAIPDSVHIDGVSLSWDVARLEDETTRITLRAGTRVLTFLATPPLPGID